MAGALAALVLAGLLGAWSERYRAQGWGPAPAAAGGGAWAWLAAATAGALVLAALGLAAWATREQVRAVTGTFEQVKGFMRGILESIPTGVLTLDGRGVVTSLNAAGERLLALRASTILGRPVAEALQAVPELARWVSEALSRERLLQESELTVGTADGRRLGVRASAAELRGESGSAEGLVVLLRDVTEVSRLEAQLRRADKLAALGTLAAGVAHEVRNPLHALSLNLHLLETELGRKRPDQTAVTGYLEVLRFELGRLDRIVENFLRFSRPAVPEMKPVAVPALLERVLGLVAFEAAGHGVSIETRCDPGLETLTGDEGQLSQVLLNVVINALQAMPEGGALVVAARKDGPVAEIAVQDTGPGIPPDALPHVFDPYFTTRPGGVGLGLAIAHRIVQAHQGSMDVESQLGGGTRVLIRLPVDAAAGRGAAL